MANEALKGYDEDTLSSHEIMANIGDAERDRFVAFQALFESKGWQYLQEIFQAQANLKVVEAFQAESWEKNREAYGAQDAFQRAARMGDTVMNEFESIARQSIEVQEEDDSFGL